MSTSVHSVILFQKRLQLQGLFNSPGPANQNLAIRLHLNIHTLFFFLVPEGMYVHIIYPKCTVAVQPIKAMFGALRVHGS